MFENIKSFETEKPLTIIMTINYHKSNNTSNYIITLI